MACERRFEDHRPDQIRQARRAYPILTALVASSVANGEDPKRSYDWLAPQLDVGPLAVSDALSPIQCFCEEKGWPRLQALIVSKTGKEKGLPGKGYHGDRTKRGHAEEVKRVLAYSWPKGRQF